MPEEVLQDAFNTEDNEVVRQRKDKLLRLRSEEGYDPYVNETWDRKDTLESIRERFDYLEAEQEAKDSIIKTAGRVMTIRRQGKATFADLADETSRMQLYFQLNSVGEKEYDFLKKWVDTGDWIGIVGYPCRTRRGELTILVTEYKLLSKAIRPLPEKWHGLTDTEIRYRKRYMDLIANPEVREVFRERHLKLTVRLKLRHQFFQFLQEEQTQDRSKLSIMH